MKQVPSSEGSKPAKGRWSSLAKHPIAKLAASTVGAHSLTLALTPVLTRLYSPESYGLYSAFMAISMVLSTFLSFRLELRIPTVTEDTEAKALSVASCFLVVLTSAITCVLLALGWAFGIGHTSVSSAGQIMLMFLILVASGVVQVIRFSLIRKKHYNSLATLSLFQNIPKPVAQIALSFLSSGLILGELLGRGASALFALRHKVFKKSYWSELRDEKYRYRESVKTHIVPSSFSALGSFINTLSSQIMPIAVMSILGAADAGHWALAARVGVVPMVLFGTAIAQFFFGQASEQLRSSDQNARKVLLKYVSTLFLLGIIPAICLGFGAPLIVTTLLGPSWEQTGYVLSAMTPVILAQFCYGPVAQYLNIIGRNFEQLLLDIVKVLLTSGLLFWAVQSKIGLLRLATFYAWAMASVYALSLCVSLYASPKKAAQA